MRDKYILIAESVTEGHPDKLCDTIADRVLDACLEHDPSARVACEVMATAGKIIVAGEITAAELPDIPAIVCQTVRETGYGSDYEVEVITHDQSGDIAGAVDSSTQLGAGDQGIMYGYNALKIVVLNRTDGPVDTMVLKLKDLLGTKAAPCIWDDSGNAQWYGHRPTIADYEAIRQAADDYLGVFREEIHRERPPASKSKTSHSRRGQER